MSHSTIDRATGEILTPHRPYQPATPNALATIGALSIGGASLPILLTRALADAAIAIAESGAKGDKAKVSLELTLTPGRGPMALVCDCKIAYAHPTHHGKKSEESHAAHEVFCSASGAVTTVPDTQGNLDF